MKLHFRKMGQGAPLIILHGLFGSSDNWQTLGKKFAGDFTVYLVDQRNHGHSPWSDEFSYKAMCDDLLELIQAENITRANFIGHSMGGKTVMTFAQLYPDYVLKMVVADIGPQAYPPHHDTIVAALNSIDLKVLTSRKAVEDKMSEYLSDVTTRQFLLKNLYWNEKDKLAWRINIPALTRALPDVIGAVPNKTVDIPALFLRGEHSGYITDADIDVIKALFPKSIVGTISGAGHWLHAEKPQEFYEAVMGFFGENL